MKRWLVLIGVLILVVILIRGYIGSLQGATDPTDNTLQPFVIQKGESTSSIVKRLKQAKLIKSELVFRYVLKQKGMEGKVQAGDFKLSKAMNMQELVKNLSSGAVDVWVTFLEGWRNEEFAQKLNVELGIKNEEFLKAAKGKQGYLFPDTYLINRDATTQDIISLLENTFTAKLPDDFETQVKKLGLTKDEAINLASVVEREARSSEVRTNVASILLRRLNINMGLNADATIQYILGFQEDDKSWWKKSLTRNDLKTESDYNTYLYKGLPPTPICNPSLSSLQAVMSANPKTPYLYYYHDSKGNSYYAGTLEEHNINVANHR